MIDGHEVGRIEQAGSGLRFTYARAWLDEPTRFAISHSLPLREAPFDQEAQRFFGNLLPEGPARTSVIRNLKLSDENDFALLRALGRDCAGVLRVVDPDEPRTARARPRRVTKDELARWSLGNGYATSDVRDLRLSVAGAQHKLGVVLDGDELVIPGDDSPSTHLLKLPNRDFAALPENEALVLAVARAIGLDVVESRLYPTKRAPLLLVTRYDRVGDPVRRVHQEDLCQALGFDRKNKYEAEGGPSFAQCIDLIRKLSVRPLDQRALLEWLAFCAVVGNRDNHAKNLSILRDDRGRWRLAPFYDLVCTRAYRTAGTDLAMWLGGCKKSNNLPRSVWENEAKTIEVTRRFLTDIVAQTVAKVERVLPDVHEELGSQVTSRQALVATMRAIKKSLNTVERGLQA
jgi:serine/threonine-protein kinase HipA